jgi:hypothetical protein
MTTPIHTEVIARRQSIEAALERERRHWQIAHIATCRRLGLCPACLGKHHVQACGTIRELLMREGHR